MLPPGNAPTWQAHGASGRGGNCGALTPLNALVAGYDSHRQRQSNQSQSPSPVPYLAQPPCPAHTAKVTECGQGAAQERWATLRKFAFFPLPNLGGSLCTAVSAEHLVQRGLAQGVAPYPPCNNLSPISPGRCD